MMVFSLKKELFSWTYLLKKTQRKTKILISPVWNKILKFWETLFELINIEGEISSKFFLRQEVGAFGNNVGKEP